MLSEQLQATITDWIAHDPDEATAAELSSLYDEAKAANPDAIAELEGRFAGPLEFGTAGLRGVVAAGQSRMNRATVIRATAGLVAHLKTLWAMTLPWSLVAMPATARLTFTAMPQRLSPQPVARPWPCHSSCPHR